MKKTCRNQGRIRSDGCFVCQYDGSRRRFTGNCNKWHCAHWRPTWWERFFDWLNGSIIDGKHLSANEKHRRRKEAQKDDLPEVQALRNGLARFQADVLPILQAANGG